MSATYQMRRSSSAAVFALRKPRIARSSALAPGASPALGRAGVEHDDVIGFGSLRLVNGRVGQLDRVLVRGCVDDLAG